METLFAINSSHLKKLLGILVLGLLLTGCRSFSNVNEASHNINMRAKYAEFAVKRYHEGYRFFAVAYTNTKGEIIFSGSKKNIETARSDGIEHCNREWKVNDCYVFESWDLSNIDIEDVPSFVMLGRGPEYYDIFHPKNIELASQTCNEIGFKKTDSDFSSCVLRVIELKNNKQGNPSQAAIMSYVSDIKETQENEIRKKI